MDVQRVLRNIGVKPVKGQNFLKNDNVVDALVEAGEVDDKVVLEIGPGTGAITRKLADRASKLYTVEQDTTLAKHIEDRFSDIDVANDDFLQYDIPEDVERCVSNLPFQISSKAIEKLGKHQIQSALILQKELVDKAVASPGDSNYGRFTLLVNYYFVPVKLRNIGSDAYYPSPDVDTAILKLYPNKDRHGIKDEELFFTVTRALFTHKRKKTRNAFVDSRHILEITKDEAKEIRDDIPHSEERVINLDVRKIADIVEFLQNSDSM
jgi:16S rRNA (adenine1518-N6/adenine1519-N6)-dimethyltransferase